MYIPEAHAIPARIEFRWIYLKISGLWDINEQSILHSYEKIYLKLNFFVAKGHQIKYGAEK